jgi:hypothetical protein
MEWFQASAIHLSSAKQTDFLVIGHVPTSDDSMVHYWLVRTRGEQADVVLVVGGHTLHLAQSRNHGLRDVVVSFSFADGVSSMRYVFNGHRYVEASGWRYKNYAVRPPD